MQLRCDHYRNTKYGERREIRCLQGCRARKVEDMVPKSILSMPIPVGFNAGDEEKWFHFQGNSLPSWGAFSKGKEYSAPIILG
jgi:hypothetical protein